MDAPLRRFLAAGRNRSLLNFRRLHLPEKVKDRAEVIKLELAAVREETDLKYLDESGFVHGTNVVIPNKGLFDLSQSC
ncbi:hypothetical protein LC653_23595 [Nostoc sp. CHAB 5784]|uniref:Transposase n=1 Tax=Nostoc favosum CHAB5714 TaxID=2780399 RepID=A0ABS8I402_9NOSO|nr:MULTISPECIES: hypothetical protein [Nostoc]MCC5598914.1 hypothetical protein [Nostoc favosum CHAB5714]MCC5666793.1 hypothetical protein [Nostoc mirabile CHAB5784]